MIMHDNKYKYSYVDVIKHSLVYFTFIYILSNKISMESCSCTFSWWWSCFVLWVSGGEKEKEGEQQKQHWLFSKWKPHWWREKSMLKISEQEGSFYRAKTGSQDLIWAVVVKNLIMGFLCLIYFESLQIWLVFFSLRNISV